MTIKEWQKKIHKMAQDKGWWDKKRSPLEEHMLMVTEIAEATEAWRSGDSPVWAEVPAKNRDDADLVTEDLTRIILSRKKPEGEAVELVDCFIRMLDYFGHKGWDFEKILEAKVNYNATRTYRHGNKKA
jgi:hypothetical protein